MSDYPVCQNCGKPFPLNASGYCAGCMRAACSMGDHQSIGVIPGNRVDLEIAAQAVHEHRALHTSPDLSCILCQLMVLDSICDECDTAVGDLHTTGVIDDHRLQDGTILQCCEGFVTTTACYAYTLMSNS